MTDTALPYFLTPISKLPLEILTCIFQTGNEEEFQSSLFQLPNPFRRPTPFILQISQVCHLWRHLSRSVPALWSTLPFYETYDARCIEDFLDLSGNSLLSVKLSSGLRIRDSPPSYIPALYGHSNRIRLLHLTTQSSTPTPELQNLLEQSMPVLETLVLNYGSGIWTLESQSAATFPYLLRAGAPSLTNFISFRCCVDLSSPTMSGLQNLEIHNVPQPYCPTISQWLDYLQGTPSLNTLCISRSIAADNDYHRIAELPNLCTLRFTGGGLGFGLLSHLVLPQLDELSISLSSGHGSDTVVTEEDILTTFYRCVDDERIAGSSIDLRIQRRSLCIQTSTSPLPTGQGRSPPLRFFIELKWDTTYSIPSDTSTILDCIHNRFHRVTSLITRFEIFANIAHVTLRPSDFDVVVPPRIASSLMSFFQHLSSVHTWTTFSSDDICLLTLLARGQSRLVPSSSCTNAAFPSLQILEIGNLPLPGDMRCVKEFVLHRRELERPIQVIRVPAGHTIQSRLARDLNCSIETLNEGFQTLSEKEKIFHQPSSFLNRAKW